MLFFKSDMRKFDHCRVYVTDFREEGGLFGPPPSVDSTKIANPEYV